MKNPGLSKGVSPGGPDRAPVRIDGPVRLPWGFAAAVTRAGMLLRVEWEASETALRRRILRADPGSSPARPGTTPAGRLLRAYARGEILREPEILSLPFAWDRTSPFEARILKALAGVPYGQTVTYGQLARLAGEEGSARACGGALARNRWPVLLPCHRVVPASGGVGEFGKGSRAKEAILRFERDRVGREDCL